MSVRRAVAASVVLFCLTSGAAREHPARQDGSWVGSVTTEGGTTSVVNESGSVWGEPARLVEEASIGVDVGDDAYMLGRVASLAARGGHIYVLDRAIPTVRVYDLAGTHVRDIGRAGNGPGELGRAREGGPTAIAFDAAGRLYVRASNKIETFSAAGDPLDTWTMDRPHGGWGDFGMGITPEPAAILTDRVRCERPLPWGCGSRMLAVKDDGAPEDRGLVPDLGYEPPRIEVESDHGAGLEFAGGPPTFGPDLVWTIDREGGPIVGRSDRYEINRYAAASFVTSPGDATPVSPTMVIAKYWEPVAVQDAEHDWFLTRNRLRTTFESVTKVGGYDLGDGLPQTKPAFQRFVSSADGGLWVVRAGPGSQRPACTTTTSDHAEMLMNPCWHDTPIFDVFGADGRFLGQAETPAALAAARSLTAMFRTPPFVDGRMLLAVVEDEAGTIMVKRYRLVPPGER